jgi:hypothetical protein
MANVTLPLKAQLLAVILTMFAIMTNVSIITVLVVGQLAIPLLLANPSCAI